MNRRLGARDLRGVFGVIGIGAMMENVLRFAKAWTNEAPGDVENGGDPTNWATELAYLVLWEYAK